MSYGIFESVRFINEGQQADEYRARKAKEAEDKHNNERERYLKRYAPNDQGMSTNVGSRHLIHKKSYNSYKGRGDRRNYINSDFDDMSRSDQAKELVEDEFNKRRKGYTAIEYDSAIDASNRRMRRHPKHYTDRLHPNSHKNESSIFEVIEII